MGGDFNAIPYPEERFKEGRIDNSMRRFSDILNDMGLRDLPVQGGGGGGGGGLHLAGRTQW